MRNPQRGLTAAAIPATTPAAWRYWPRCALAQRAWWPFEGVVRRVYCTRVDIVCPSDVVSRNPKQRLGGIRVTRSLSKLRERRGLAAVVLWIYCHDCHRKFPKLAMWLQCGVTVIGSQLLCYNGTLAKVPSGSIMNRRGTVPNVPARDRRSAALA